MAKPIFIIGLPQMAEAYVTNLQQIASSKMKGYYVLIVNLPMSSEPVFKAFYEKDFNEVKYNELKEIVLNSLEKNE